MAGQKEATITVIKTRDGDYGLHGDWHWDALPYWEYYPASIVRITSSQTKTEARLFTDRSREIYGTPISEEDYKTAREAGENWAIERALAMEKEGYEVNLDFRE